MSPLDLPIPVLVTRHQCPHCRRTHAKKAAAVAHIARCWLNPANRSCKGCAHYQQQHFSTPAEWCEPGRSCSCNDWDEACTAADGPEDDYQFPVTNCPLWEARS